MDNKSSCLVYRNKKRSWNFVPSPAMRKAGFHGKSFGSSESQARAYVQKQLKKWSTIKAGKRSAFKIHNRSSNAENFPALVEALQRDPEWYGDLAYQTRAQANLCFKHIVTYFEEFPIRLVAKRHCRAYYNDTRTSESIHKAHKVIKWLHRLLEYSIELGSGLIV